MYIPEGRDPADYDFQPEWVLYWPGRMEEILQENIELIKKKLKQKCGISDNIEPVEDLKRQEAVKSFRNPSPVNKIINEAKPKNTVGTEQREDMHRLSAKVQDDDKSDVEDLYTGPLSTVSVLRLLTALEDHLGSLGPKVVDLLAKALTLDKVILKSLKTN